MIYYYFNVYDVCNLYILSLGVGSHGGLHISFKFQFQKFLWKTSPINSTISDVIRYYTNVTSYYYDKTSKRNSMTTYFFKLSIALIKLLSQ